MYVRAMGLSDEGVEMAYSLIDASHMLREVTHIGLVYFHDDLPND